MNKFLAGVLAAGALFAAPLAAMAADEETPIITFHTNIFDTYGAGNSFHITIGATEPMYIDYDCGYGLCEEYIEVANFDSDAEGMTGTAIQMTVSKEGMVRIYGDAAKIDYIDFEGCYISDIQWPELTNVAILNLQHNELESLDLSHMKNLQVLWIDDNPFTKSPFILGTDHPDMFILSLNMVDNIDRDFDIKHFPKLASFSAYGASSITKLTPSACPELRQLSIDGTNVSEIDVTQNPYLLILNVSETRVTDLDLSGNPYLTELYVQHEATLNGSYKFKKLDISKNPELVRLYLNGNSITELDLSNNPKINSLACRRNLLTSLSFENNPAMGLVDISKNYMNFNTMPTPDQVLGDYEYTQYPIPVDRSYPVGTVLDFTDKVIRNDGSITSAGLFAVNPEDPANPELLDDDYFSFVDGKFTINEAYPDSVYIAFHNSTFSDYDMTTGMFMMKDVGDFGKPSIGVTMRTPSAQTDIHFSVGVDGATPEAPVEFYVDFGDGELKPFQATSATYSDTDNVSGTRAGLTTIVYMPEGKDLTALRVDGVRLSQLGVTEAAMLRHLRINNCGLSAIDLNWNRCLSLLDLSNNNLEKISLLEPNPYYTKTMLGTIDLSHNKLSEMTLVDPYNYYDINVSYNQLTSIVLDNAISMRRLDVSNNLMPELSLEYCESLQELNAANNLLTSLEVPSYTPLKKLNVAGNSIPLPALPLPSKIQDYTYAPQQPVVISAKAPTVNLTAYNLTVGSDKTQYVWHLDADDSIITDGITAKDGAFIFDNPDLGLIYCTIAHPAFPDFAGENVIKTTSVQTAAPPTHIFATLTPGVDGTLALAFATTDADGDPETDPAVEIYADWEGNGDLVQYILHQGYASYEGKGVKDVEARFYSYDDNDNVSVFSVTGNIKKIDGSKLSDVMGFYVYGFTGESADMKLPTASTLSELALDNANLSEIDLSACPGVTYLSLNNNKITNLDVTVLPKLACMYVNNNPGIKVKFNNPRLWELAMTGCELEEIDLTGCPAMQQLWLTSNNLSHIDVEGMSGLKVLAIGSNKFDFNTLPLPKDSYYRYDYGNQAPIQLENSASGKVDLSQYKERDGENTLYQWFIGMPYIDDYGMLAGEELYVDEEYNVYDGVTTFHYPFDDVMCVMTNALFPNLYLYTNIIDIEAAGIDEVLEDIATGEAVYYNLQGVRVDNPSTGIYLRRQGGKTTKVLIK